MPRYPLYKHFILYYMKWLVTFKTRFMKFCLVKYFGLFYHNYDLPQSFHNLMWNFLAYTIYKSHKVRNIICFPLEIHIKLNSHIITHRIIIGCNGVNKCSYFVFYEKRIYWFFSTGYKLVFVFYWNHTHLIVIKGSGDKFLHA